MLNQNKTYGVFYAMSQILASPTIPLCMILLSAGILYCLWDGRIDIEFPPLKIIGKGGKKNKPIE
jgi:hypothetical protein